jgi:hypothetical protein
VAARADRPTRDHALLVRNHPAGRKRIGFVPFLGYAEPMVRFMGETVVDGARRRLDPARVHGELVGDRFVGNGPEPRGRPTVDQNLSD